jgi:hypothetical protein
LVLFAFEKLYSGENGTENRNTEKRKDNQEKNVAVFSPHVSAPLPKTQNKITQQFRYKYSVQQRRTLIKRALHEKRYRSVYFRYFSSISLTVDTMPGAVEDRKVNMKSCDMMDEMQKEAVDVARQV